MKNKRYDHFTETAVHLCWSFPVNNAKNLRNPFFTENLQWLLPNLVQRL